MRKIILLFAAFLLFAFHAQSQIIYVDINVVGGANNGTSWANAFSNLQSAINIHAPGNQIYVAQGIYKPSVPAGRDATFNLPNNLTIYGGFSPSNGAINLATKDPLLYQTILSGDIGAIGNISDNCYSVVTTMNVNNTVTADGFIIENGNANEIPANTDAISPRSMAGAWYNYTDAIDSNIVINQCTFRNNAGVYGGALTNDMISTGQNYSCIITNSIFHNNNALSPTGAFATGGAMYNATWFGSIGFGGLVSITNSLLYKNNATWEGGAMYNIVSSGGSSLDTEINSCTFSLNTAGGGFSGFNIRTSGGTAANAPLTITNSVIYGIEDGIISTNELYRQSGLPTVITNSLVEGFVATSGGLDGTDPSIQPNFTNSTLNDFTLAAASPLIDAGDNSFVTSPTDLNGDVRIQDGDGNGSVIVDIGAYESPTIFICTDPDVPTITSSPANPCPGDNVTLTITGNLNDATAWEIYSGSCGGTFVGSTAASTFVVNPAVNTTYFIRGEGGCVTPGACGSVAVNVADVTPPTITCPGNQIENFDASCQFTLPDYTSLVATSDGCDASPTVTQSPVPTTVIAGLTTITMTSTDASGNMATCTFDVVPNDATPPTITCPGNQVGNADASCMFTLPDYTGLATAADNCGIPTVTQSPAIGSVVGLGTTTITLTASDGVNTASCTFDLIANDVTPPTISCPGNQTGSADASCMFTLLDYTGLATASDNCGSPTITQVPAAGSAVGLGITTITLTASDGINSTSCTFNVDVQDTLPPTITCPGTQIETADASCMFTLLDYTGLATAADNCGSVTVTQAPIAGTVVAAGITVITFTASDGTNMTSCTFDVDVQGGATLTITCPGNQVETFDASCMFTLPDYTSLVTTTPGCSGAATVAQSPVAGTVISGTTIITMTATEPNGSSVTCTFDVIANDVTPPTISCPGNQTGSADASCMFTLLDYTGLATASDNCGSPTITQVPAAGSAVGIGVTIITLTASDGINSTSCTFNVNVQDTLPPTITCPGTQIETADASCMFTLPDYTGLATASDNCGSVTVTQAPIAGTVVGAGITVITFTASDGTNMTSCSFNVDVQGGATLTVTCPGNQMETFDASCMFTLPDYTSLVTTTPGCSGAATVTQSPVAGTVISGTTIITMTATEPNGNSVTCTFDVIANDVTPPTISCPGNQTGSADASCMFTLLDYTGFATASDNCGVPTITQVPAAGSAVGLGITTITLTASDGINSTSCTFDVDVQDTLPPTITCPGTQIETADASCMFTLPDYTGLATATDNCGSVTVTQAPIAGTVVGAGITVITFTASDGTNMTSCSFNVDVQGGATLTVTCPGNQMEIFDASCMFTLPDYTSLVTTTPGCSGAATVAQSPVAGTVISGTTIITMTATEPNGNSVTCTFDVIANDVTPPTISCPGNQTESADASCMFTLLDYTGLATASDNCGVPIITQVPAAGSAVGAGITTITLTASDGTNTANCTFDIDVQDTIAPTANCPGNQNENFDASCQFTLPDYTSLVTAADNCDPTPSVVQSPPAGTVISSVTSITMTVTDSSGNPASCSFDVIPNDVTPPSISCPATQTETADASCMFSLGDYTALAVASDNCATPIITQSPAPGTLVGLGISSITLTASDGANMSSCSFDVDVIDATAPSAVCVAPFTIQLDASGMASIVPTDIEDGSTDNCGIAGFGIDITNFDCSNLGPNTVTLTVVDTSGNTDSCTTIITVEDNVAPMALCQNITVQLNAAGMVNIVPADIDNGSSDACGITNMSIDISSFDCSNVGLNNVVLTVTDISGNTDSCTTVVTVEDMVAPMVTCQDITIVLDGSGMATIIPSDINGGASDACGIAAISIDIDTFDCSNVGPNDVVLSVTDVNGNVGSCTAVVTVEDNEFPIAVCQDITVQLDATGSIMIVSADIDAGSTDNCANTVASVDIDTFDCTNVGTPVTVTLTITDPGGNASSCTALVTVEDAVAPNAVCQDITIQLDSNGMATIVPADIDGGSADACGISSLAIDINTFDCSNIGPNNVTLSVSDVNGNVSTCIAVVTVEEENAVPTAVCQNLTVPLQQDGTATITPENVNAGSSGAGCFNGLSLDIDTFDCSDIGTPVTVTLTVTNGNGDTSSCTSIITVVDTIGPEVTCPPDQAVDAIGQYILPDYFATGEATSDDNCTDPVTIFSQDPAPGTPLDFGMYTIELTATDDLGHVGSCSFELTVDDALGTNEVSSLNSLIIYPNPATDFVLINNSQQIELEKIEIFDLTGRLVVSESLESMGIEKSIEISSLQSANYIVIISSDKQQLIKQLVIE